MRLDFRLTGAAVGAPRLPRRDGRGVESWGVPSPTSSGLGAVGANTPELRVTLRLLLPLAGRGAGAGPAAARIFAARCGARRDGEDPVR